MRRECGCPTGKRKRIPDAIREQRDEVMNDDIKQPAGTEEKLPGLLPAGHGCGREEVQRRQDEFMERYAQRPGRARGRGKR